MLQNIWISNHFPNRNIGPDPPYSIINKLEEIKQGMGCVPDVCNCKYSWADLSIEIPPRKESNVLQMTLSFRTPSDWDKVIIRCVGK